MAQRQNYRGGHRDGRRGHPYQRPMKEQPPTASEDHSNFSESPEGTGGGLAAAELMAGGTLDGARKEKKFSNRARLFVGNLPRDFNEHELKKLFEEFGDVKEVFIKKDKNFGFVRMGYRSDCERAITSLNGRVIKQRDIKVRFAASSCSIKVSNLHPLVSNELLAEAFSQFGEVEFAVVVTDDRGKPLGHGIVDFARKAQAINAIQRCRSEHFLLTGSPIPVLVTEWIRDNDEDGLPERNLAKNSAYVQEREAPPRFASPGSFEYSVATRWKEQYDLEASQREELEKSIKQARYQLQHGVEGFKEQHQTMMLRQELAHHHEQQLRLEQKLRQREERHMLLGNQTTTPPAPDPPVPLFPPMGAAPDASSAEHDTNLYTTYLPPVSGAMAFAPPPLMGQPPTQKY